MVVRCFIADCAAQELGEDDAARSKKKNKETGVVS